MASVDVEELRSGLVLAEQNDARVLYMPVEYGRALLDEIERLLAAAGGERGGEGDGPKAALIREAIRFANWAAGEGICPIAGEPATAPEEFLFDYSMATGDEEWETLADRIAGGEAGGEPDNLRRRSNKFASDLDDA